MDETKWPEGFSNIGGKTFAWVRQNRQEWVDFSLNEMENPSGFFKKWQDYLIKRRNEENTQQTGDEIHKGNHPSER